jgi:hypothetical protein
MVVVESNQKPFEMDKSSYYYQDVKELVRTAPDIESAR